MGEAPRVLVLGIGNLLWADEGWGVRAVDQLHRFYLFPDTVKLMDGGTQGLYLVQHICEADVLVVFDAVDYGLEPGTLMQVENDQVPQFMGAKKMSLHQTGFQEVIASADLLGHKPSEMLLIGLQPVELEDYGGSLRPLSREQISPAIEIALQYLAARGIIAELRGVPLGDAETLASPEMVLEVYEGNRPSPDEACRTADIRFLAAEPR